MARLYAQLFMLVFLVIGVVGLFLGDAGTIHGGQAQGNLGSLTLHLTWVRDVLDFALMALFAYVGFVASRHTGRILVTAAGALLLVLAIAGFVVGDDATASKGFLDMHFPTAVNVFDLVAGLLGVLSGLGTVEDAEPA